jgi:hypothetical protein
MPMFYGSETIEVPTGDTDSALLLKREEGDTTCSYRLGTLPLQYGSYMFTIWVKAMQDVTLNIDLLGSNQVFNINHDEWTKITMQNDSPTVDEDGNVIRYIDIIPFYNTSYAEGVNDSIYMYEAMLEMSSTASAWYPAPEDDQAAIDGLSERVASAELLLKEDSIVATVMQSEKYKQQFSELNTTISSEVQQTVSDFTITFKKTQEYVDENKAYIADARSYINFDDGGIHMGNDTDPFTMNLSNQRLEFNQNGNTVAYIDNETMHISNAEITTKMTINGFAFTPTETGMALMYVGREGGTNGD